MPTLHWIGKDKVINHHLDVPYKVLDHQYRFENGTETNKETKSGNKIIHGDNLEALKSLLPEYEGKIKCIYIDPPYNTGNEGWVYNDNVNDPKINNWLNNVVGKEGDDLSRHDKWLCMMYPRLKLLHKLLADDGIIFVSIDNFEYNYLSLILEEIFGRKNLVETLIWKKSYGGGAKSKHVVNLHEYIYFYAKNIEILPELSLPPDESVLKYYKFKDSKYDKRGPYRLQPLATTSMDDRPNLKYPINYNNEEIWPEKQWQWSKDRVYLALENDDLVIEKKKGKYSVNYKQYLKNEEGIERGKKLYSIIEGLYTQQGTSELKKIFNDTVFNFPKPSELIITLLQIVTQRDSLILDSFAGSGTTAHAVIELNKKDNGTRKFILIEMENYAETVTAERIKRVITNEISEKANDVGFDFYRLGQPLFKETGELNEDVGIEKLRTYIYYTETNLSLTKSTFIDNEYHLDLFNQTSYYFYYQKDNLTSLDDVFLSTIKNKAEQYIIYADNCLLNPDFMKKQNIIFKKIPRDISKF
jgi:adenine-specific DNA-methyltransferase